MEKHPEALMKTTNAQSNGDGTTPESREEHFDPLHVNDLDPALGAGDNYEPVATLNGDDVVDAEPPEADTTNDQTST